MQIDLNHQALKSLMRFRPSLKDAAIFFSVSEDTVERRVKDWEGCTYKEFKERHSLGIKHRLMDRAFEIAMSGNTAMMIFLLKNLCGFSDTPKNTFIDSPSVIKLAYTPISQRKPSEVG